MANVKEHYRLHSDGGTIAVVSHPERKTFGLGLVDGNVIKHVSYAGYGESARLQEEFKAADVARTEKAIRIASVLKAYKTHFGSVVDWSVNNSVIQLYYAASNGQQPWTRVFTGLSESAPATEWVELAPDDVL